MAKKLLLTVCTGNTCRSPMAQVILQRIISRKGLAGQYRVESGGLDAVEGLPASTYAQAAAAQIGLDLSSHRARAITRGQLLEAETIYVMRCV